MKLLYLVLFLFVSCLPVGQEAGEEELMETGRLFSRQFYTRSLDSLHAHIVDRSFTLNNLREFRGKVEGVLGVEAELYNEKIVRVVWEGERYYGYVRHSKFSLADRPVRTSFGFDREKNIHRFEVLTIPMEAESRFEDYVCKTLLRPPFEGEWYIAAGGRSSMHNQHAPAVDQRFAYDFIIQRDGVSYKGNGFRNGDYFCYGARILAPGKGRIVDMVDTIPENRVGDMPATSGNRVIIDHQNGEYSILSHFMKGSIVVKKGDEVEIGQYLGLCGNSGHSSEPHLHYHLQNSPVMFDGEGLPVRFKSYYSNGNFAESGEPGWGEYVMYRE